MMYTHMRIQVVAATSIVFSQQFALAMRDVLRDPPNTKNITKSLKLVIFSMEICKICLRWLIQAGLKPQNYRQD